MAKVHPIFTSFTTGEVSPLMYGRVDFAKYAAGLRVLLNYIIRPHGPVYRRPGTHFVCEVKDSTKFTRLLDFEFSTEQAYVIEAGDLYFRFYKDGGRINTGVPIDITNVANNGSGLIRVTAVAHGLTTDQGVDIAGVVGVPVVNQSWPRVTVIDPDNFDLPGSLFVGTYDSGGTATGVVEVATPYTSAQLPFVKYVQSADTMYFTHPEVAVHKLTRQSHTSWTMVPVSFKPPATFESGLVSTGTITFGATSGLGVSITLSAADLLASDVGRMITVGSGRAIIKTFATTTTGTVDIVDTLPGVGPHASGTWTIQGSPNTQLTPSAAGPAHAVVTLTLAGNGWRAGYDVGRYVRVNRGVARIIAVTSATVASAELLTALENATASPGGSWSLEESAWSVTRGFPRALGFFEQRLVFAGSAAQPQTFWGTVTGDYEVVALGADDDDAYEFQIAANEVNTINWIVPTRVLMMGTASTEFVAKGSDGASNPAITPNNVDVKPSTFWGSSARIQPPRIGNAALFVTRSGTELRELIFSAERDNYVANDMLLLADHLTETNTVLDVAYQQHPNSTVWCVRDDGVLLAFVYQRDHEVAGWARCITGPDLPEVTPVKGKYEAVVVIPHWQGDRDVAWFVIQRQVAAGSKRYVEYNDDVSGFYGGLGIGGGLGMDSALTYDGAPTQSVTGLWHLEGEEVVIVGDGAVYPSETVQNGSVTLDGPMASVIEIGLNFNSKLETMRPEVPQAGTSQGLIKHWSRIWVRVHNTLGLFVNGEEKSFRSPNDPMDEAPPLFSGDIKHDNVGRDRDGILMVEQRQPLPSTIVSIFGTLSVGGE